MKVGRIIGWALLLAALAAAGYELNASIHNGGWRPVALGELWYRISPGSLTLMQAAVERHIAGWLWQPGIVSILRLPGWLVFGVPAGLLLWLCRRRRPRRRFRFR